MPGFGGSSGFLDPEGLSVPSWKTPSDMASVALNSGKTRSVGRRGLGETKVNPETRCVVLPDGELAGVRSVPILLLPPFAVGSVFCESLKMNSSVLLV
jgi:hypothetical protein